MDTAVSLGANWKFMAGVLPEFTKVMCIASFPLGPLIIESSSTVIYGLWSIKKLVLLAVSVSLAMLAAVVAASADRVVSVARLEVALACDSACSDCFLAA